MNTIVNPNLVPDTSAAKQTVSKQQAVQQVKNEQTVSSVPAVQKTDTRAEEIKSGTVQSQSNVPAAANTKEIEESSSAKKKGQQQTQTLRVELSKLDNLMNLVGELVINKIGFSTQLEKITVYIDEIESNLHHINLHLENADLRNSLDMYEKFQEEFMNILNNGDNISRDNLIKSFKELIKTHSLLFGSDNIINKLYENWKTMVVEYQQISSYYLELYKSSIVLASKIGHIAKDLQENVMQTRMLPISNVFNKYKRTVRDLSQKMKKEIHLELEGEETEMDKNIIEKIGDPLTHIIRNSIDHGLEFPDVRVKEGKPRVGTIKLSAYNQGGAVFIEIEDDGKGIDADIICSKAVEKGLITAERAEMMNEQEKLNLLFIPGFSTAEKVTEISGRGVGMDVVRENITKLKGMIDIRTKIGQGTKMTIKLPLTLAILQVLQVREGTDLFAIPSNNIIEIFSTKLKTLEKVKNIYMINNRGKYIPVYYLSDILGLYSEPINPDADTAIIIVGMGNNNIGLIVSEIVRKEEVVIKNLGDFIKKIRFVSGATIEGDATITLILNISKIIEYISNKGINSGSRTFTSDTETSGVSGTDKTVQSKTKKSGNKRILVVEDSTTTRKMIRSIIESAGYEVIEAVDGIDGLDKLKNAGHFDLATVDVNMPRLNGYGFTQEVRKLEQFAKFPIIMITTRDLNVDKTKGFEAGVDDYIVKPFEPAELINVIRTYIC
jgi:chemotaxis protein histidine kinase CheA